jgi:hypothetical protein
MAPDGGSSVRSRPRSAVSPVVYHTFFRVLRVGLHLLSELKKLKRCLQKQFLFRDLTSQSQELGMMLGTTYLRGGR